MGFGFRTAAVFAAAFHAINLRSAFGEQYFAVSRAEGLTYVPLPLTPYVTTHRFLSHHKRA